MAVNFEKLVHVCLERNIPFVAYRLPGPGSEIKVWLQRSGKMLFVEHVADLAGKTGFVYAPFHRLTNFPVIFFEPEFIVEAGQVSNTLIRELEDAPPLYQDYASGIPEEMSREGYLQQVDRIVHSLDEVLAKVVLSRVKVVEKPDKFDEAAFFLSAARNYPGAFVHLIHIPGAGTWSGASPELLLTADGGQVTTVALAGTRKITGSDNPEWGEKEIEEQEMVSRHVEQVITDAGISDFSRGQAETINAGHLQHISTVFSFGQDDLRDDITAFISALHPTPAVCGLPVEQALEVIRKAETHNREYYAGYCGPVRFEGETNLFVNLRCMKILPEDLAIFVGGGLTKQSVAADEWNETEWKAKTLLSII